MKIVCAVNVAKQLAWSGNEMARLYPSVLFRFAGGGARSERYNKSSQMARMP
jgi:hypothetical protein